MALQSPESVFFSQRPMDEETLPLPPRNEKSSPSKTAAVTVSRVVNLVFPKPSSTVPGLEAKPAEIREFLARLLVNKCGLQEDKASCIVSGWKIGSGLELRQYGAAMYLDLFGCEYGWILYREVKMSVRKEKRLITRYPLRKFIAFAKTYEMSECSLTHLLQTLSPSLLSRSWSPPSPSSPQRTLTRASRSSSFALPPSARSRALSVSSCSAGARRRAR